MKKVIKSLLILSVAFTLNSCVSEDDTALPSLKIPFFEEGFENVEQTGVIDFEGWSNVSLNGGSKLWETRYYSADGTYAQLSAFGSGETNMDTWLITPAVDLEQTTSEALRFAYKAAYYNGQALSVWVSTDYDGSNTAEGINNANWTNLNVDLPDYATSGYPSTFSQSPILDLSSYSGQIYIAFRYQGSSSGVSTTYQIDNIIIFENK